MFQNSNINVRDCSKGSTIVIYNIAVASSFVFELDVKHKIYHTAVSTLIQFIIGGLYVVISRL